MRRTPVLATLALLVLASCSSQGNWGTADAFYVAQDGDRLTLIGVDVDASDPSPVTVTELGSSTDIAAATVSYGADGTHVLISRADGTRQIRSIRAQAQQVSEGVTVPDYGTVARVEGGFASTTPEVAGPVRVQLRTDDGVRSLDTGPLAIHPITMAGLPDGFVVVGSTSEAGTVLQRVARSGDVAPPVVVAADSLPGQVATDGTTVAVALNRSIPEGASPNAKATLPADKRIAIMSEGKAVRFLEVGESPNHIVSVGNGQFVLDSTVDGERVIQVASATGPVRVLATLADGGPVLGLAMVNEHVLALQSSRITVLAMDPSQSEEPTHIAVELALNAHSEWAGQG